MRLKTGRTPSPCRIILTCASRLAREHAKPVIGKAHRLEATEQARTLRQTEAAHLAFHFDNGADLLEEPVVDLAGGVDFRVARAKTHGLRDLEQAIRRRAPQRRLDGIAVIALAETLDLDLVQPGQAGLKRAQRLLQALGEGAPDRHGLADRFHRGGQRRLRTGEFLEGETRNLW